MKTKKKFKYFTIMEYEKEQTYLRDMHKKGWKFTGVTGFCVYNFEKCEPEDVIYQLDYNEDGMKNKTQYVKMFEDCGWEYITDYVGYSYFRKPFCDMIENEEIFCDDDSRLEMVHRIFRGRMIPLFVIFGCIIIPQFITNLINDSIENKILAIALGFMMIIYLGIFISFGKKYVEYKQNIGK